MTEARHICNPKGIIKGQKLVFKATVGICAGLSLFVSETAFAQSQNSNSQQTEQPITANSTPVPQIIETLPGDLQPETLSIPVSRTLNPKDIQQWKNVRSNRWNPQTLTQPTGLSAATQRQGQVLEGPRLRANVLPTDLLSTEDLLSVGETPAIKIGVPLKIASRSDGVINLSSSLRGALFDEPTNDNVNASVFKLDLGGQPCLGTSVECAANEIRRIDFGYAKNITKGKKNGFNLQLTPHGGLRLNDDGQSALVGALVRIGDNLREGSEMKSNTWYLFAGADAEAVTYTPNSVRRLTSGAFHLQDRIIIGDAQAGLGYRLGDADLALTYYKRQATAENYSYDEDAAALSITWKR